MASKYEMVLTYLKKLGLEKVDREERNILLKKIKSNGNLESLKEELKLLFALNKSLITSYGSVSVKNMMDLYNSIDANLLLRLFSLQKEIESRAHDELEALSAFKKVALEILKTNVKVNEKIGEMLDDSFQKSLEVKDSLYLTMLDVEKADAVFDNCMKRSRLFLGQCDAKNLERIIFCLKKNYSFSDDEIVKISTKCSSFFVDSSASKITHLNKKIEEFKAYIQEQNTVMSTAEEINALLDKDFKEILFDASSIARTQSTNINKTISFLMGESLEKLTNVNKRLVGVRGNFTPYELARIYNESISSLTISVEKIGDVCFNISKVFEKTFGCELDLKNLINGNNFSHIAQLTKDDYLEDKKIGEIFSLLSEFVSEEDMANLLKNGFSFLKAPLDAVKKSLQRAVLESHNTDELRVNVIKKIRNHFDMYAGQFEGVDRKNSTYRSRSFNKVGIKDMDKNELIDVLKKLETEDAIIDEWDKKWNDETREYRILQLEIELVDLLDEIQAAKEFLNIDIVTIDQYLAEVETVKEMVLSLNEKYQSMIDGKKLNGELRILTESCEKGLDDLYDGVNAAIAIVISNYKIAKESLEAGIEENRAKLGDLEKGLKKLTELDSLIEEKGISEEKYEELIAIVDDINGFSDEIMKYSHDGIENANRAGELMKTLHELIQKSIQENILNGASEKNSWPFRIQDDVRWPLFLQVLKDEELITNTPFQLISSKGTQTYTYKKIRDQFTETELKVADEIYELLKSVKDMCIVSKAKIEEYIQKYNLSHLRQPDLDISSQSKVNLHNYLASKIVEFGEEKEKSASEMKQLLNRRKRLEEARYAERMIEITEKNDDLEKEVERYIKAINEVIKTQIKR
jgi:hypothetical protein